MGGIFQASEGIQIWRHALTKGRLPTEAEFTVTHPKNATTTTITQWWPSAPLYSTLVESMVQLQLPRFALRHPQVLELILRSILRLMLSYAQRVQNQHNDEQQPDEEDNDEDETDDYYFLQWQQQHQHQQQQQRQRQRQNPILEELLEDEESIAQHVVQELLQEWTGVVQGVNLLDGLFGNHHDWLQGSDYDSDGAAAAATVGYGIQDGIWSHSGWKEIPKLQHELANMPQLQNLIQSLGRRPTAQDYDRIERFPPRTPHVEGGMGAAFDPQLRESVSGITLSNRLSEMLPSEAILLRGRGRGHGHGRDNNNNNNNHQLPKSSTLRRLFLAKWAESKLLSYQLSGWTDIPSVPRTRPLYRTRLPSAPGGPILVCLDTSWSMTGRREALSKAVVLACVSAAHQQGRDCQVVAFSTERGVMDAGLLSPQSPDGIPRLLEFLSHSFGGGTDVTGALKHALKLWNEDESMASADLLLVTDGEIPDPPIADDLLQVLDSWKLRKGLEVHGLLIGKSESKPLSRLCTKTHNFLSIYENSLGGGGSVMPVATQPQGGGKRTRASSTALYAKRTTFDEPGRIGGGKQRKGRPQGKWVDPGDEFEDDGDWSLDLQTTDDDEEEDVILADGSYGDAVAKSLDVLRQAASTLVAEKSWSIEELDKEHAENGSAWQAHEQLRDAIERVEDGLVERSEDARLVVLAMVANEHILLLGSPGTAKSALGSRLAELCDGIFFQRLLTRFTTPEELFGPLSLSSLERDEYRRCTAGFLPTADIAFLDEIFKANSAILNTLLTILNERKFDNAGGRESCPIRCVVGASNELPESDDLAALFDRFLIRKEVVSVSDEGVLSLLSMSNPGVSSCKTDDVSCKTVFAEGLDEVISALSSAADQVTMDLNACELMRDLRTFLRQEQSVEISDRRLVKAARLLKISAASDGRNQVDPIDFLLLQHCFWNLPEQRTQIREWLWENLTPGQGSGGSSLKQFRYLLDNLRNEIVSTLRKTSGDVTGISGARAEDLAIVDSLKLECHGILTILQQSLNNLDRHIELLRRSQDFLWIDPEDANAVQQLLLPKAEVSRGEWKQATEDASALELAMSDFPESPKNEHRLEVIQELWEEGYTAAIEFTELELSMTMREAKARYDLVTFRRWKRARKKADKNS